MADIVKKPVEITETILRDAHQSLIATRMTTEQMLPIVDKMDKVGYHSSSVSASKSASIRFFMIILLSVRARWPASGAQEAFLPSGHRSRSR